MKRKILFFVMMLALTSLVTMPSCKKEAGTPSKVFYAFTEPAVVAPADAATVKISGTTVDLTWESSSQDNTALLADVYFGTATSPGLYKADVKALTLTVPVEIGQTYYWRVVMRDIHNVTTDGPTWSFTIFDPLAIFIGDFNADEPAETYSYGVSFAKSSPTAIVTDNYWNSAWTAIFTLDLTANTYSMPLTTWGTYSGEESGTIDQTTGTMVGNYTIYHPAGVAIETGVHTYTRL